MPCGSERTSTEHTAAPNDHEMEEPSPIDPPLTPKIQVLAPPDEPPEEEIRYIGVGLGTLSTADKKRRQPPGRATSEPNPTLGHRESSESLRSDASLTSGQLTPAEPMVYASPTITHENVFEHAFQRAEDKIRLTQGEDATLYNTWRSEEMRGQPVSNERGRAKVELTGIDGSDDDRPRWERALKEKLPEKFAEVYERVGDKKAALKENFRPLAEKILGDRGKQKDSDDRMDTRDVSGPAHLPTSGSGWERLLGTNRKNNSVQ